MELKTIIQIIAICGIAIFTGVMLNIGLTLGAYWKSLPPSEFLDWFKNNSHFIARTIPLYTVPTLVAVIATIWMNWDNQVVRNLWLFSSLFLIGIAAITLTWHLPVNAIFVSKQIPVEEVSAKLNLWLQLHTIRIACGFIASILGIIAIQR